MPAPLDGFTCESFTFDGRTHDVYRAGNGPAVVVMHEMPGLHPGVVDFGRRLLDAGYTVYLPSLFGRPGAPYSAGGSMRSMLRVCISREFRLLADETAPAATWLRALAAKAHTECGGPGVGAIGMCFTGGFALAMAVEPAVLAPVLSQPSLPMPIGAARPAQLGLDAADLAAVKERTQGGLRVLGLRFSEDPVCRGERFDTLRRELGDGFESIEIDSSEGNPNDIPKTSHSVLTLHLVDEPGHPTREALDRVMSFLGERLRE